MPRVALPIKTIDEVSFAPYGDVLDFTPSKPSEEGDFGRFQIITRAEDPTGWRLALLKFSNRECRRLEQHPTSKESFEPVSGVSLLFLAAPGPLGKVVAFLLDRPVCLNRGVWHDVVAISREAVVKIAENLEVESEIVELEQPWVPQVVAE